MTDTSGVPREDDEHPEVDLEDDEAVSDPQGEPDTEGAEPEDDHGADELDAGGGREPATPVVPQPSARSQRVQALANERRLLAEQNAALTRQLDDLRRAPPQPVESPQQRADRLALLTPEDRVRTEMREELAAHSQQNQAIIRQLAESTDRTNFNALASRNPLAARLSGDVERMLENMRREGKDSPREVIFTYLVGQRTLANMGKGKAAAAANRQRQQAQPARARGDVRPGRARQENTVEDMERRFGDVPI
jgi:hypothetical protein